MLGTIVNTCCIIIGTLAGTLFHKGIKEQYREILYTGLGLACLAIGLNATLSHFSQSKYPVLFIVSIAIGAAKCRCSHPLSTAHTSVGWSGHGLTLMGSSSRRSTSTPMQARGRILRKGFPPPSCCIASVP